MIVAIGTDLVEIDRIAKVLARHPERFLDRILTTGERSYCDGLAYPLPSIGARFAAKEAVMKCLGTGWSGGVGWQQIEVERAPGGKPTIRLSGAAASRAQAMGIRRVHVSLTHTARHALATVVAER